jgi:hypothetical protein
METKKEIVWDAKKIKEWREWGKEAFKSARNMAKNNHRHPDYDTPEKVEKLHDNYGDSYMLKPERHEDLKKRFGYTDEDISKAMQLFKDGYNASRQWYKKNDMKFQEIIDEYKPIWDEAQKIANECDVSDISDGFPCGSAHLYLDNYPEGEQLRKAIGHFNDRGTDAYKYILPIKMPSYGQCIRFDERICEEVREYLRSKGIFALIHSWID